MSVRPTGSRLHTRAMINRAQRRKFFRLSAVALLLLGAGYWMGLRSRWSAHHPHTVEGTAQLIPADAPFAYFKPQGREHITFRPDGIPWRTRQESGAGSIPTCILTPGRIAHVEVTVIEVSRPFGSGSYPTVQSLTCLD
jgi:hypothetical protein